MKKIDFILPHLKTTFSFIIFILCLIYILDFDLPLAFGFAFILFIHEIGHIIALKRLKIPLKGFYFIPLLGAFVSSNTFPKDLDKIAYFKYMGPFIGSLCIFIFIPLFLYTDNPLFMFYTLICASLNLINLIPISILDGKGILQGVSKHTEWIGRITLIIIGFFIFKEYSFTLFILLLSTLFQDGPEEGEGFRWHELFLSIIYILFIGIVSLFEPEYFVMNLVFLLLSIYMLYTYLKATVWSKEGCKKERHISPIPLTKRQKIKWFISWISLSTILSLIVLFIYNFYL